jgi:hypothetical protein
MTAFKDDKLICEAYDDVHNTILEESKHPKQEAQYVANGVPGNERCDNCTMWREPNKCSAVSGDIKPEAWCKWWKRSHRKK